MAESKLLFTDTYEVQSGMATQQYHIVALRAANVINIASEKVHSSMLGVLQTKPANPGNFGTVGIFGKSKVVAGAAITAGVFLTCNGSGRAVAVGSGDMAFGKALVAAGADGQFITANIFHPFRWSGAV